MSTEPPPSGSGDGPEDDLFRKPPSPPPEGAGTDPYRGLSQGVPPPPGEQPPPGGQPPPGAGGPYGAPPPPGGGSPYGTPPPYYGGDPYGGGGPYGPYGGGDPLAGMPPLADSGKRVLARIIDMILVGLVVWLLSWAFHTTEYNVDTNQIDYGKSLGQSVIAAVLYTAYDTFMTARNGQTVGKKLLNLRVANLADGSTPSVATSLIRALVLWLPFAFCCACIWTAICGGWSFFDKPYKQGLHDKAARTVEVSTR
ncbi:RDD family protein [Streptomyces nodosus]|uniref:Membrane protein n=1 Tax=Streptomyces nodosus TaxID=40318 RepID=A0A0B5DC86_9ACTN|nr:RDD family protein [Streptomyces nodosus]AJE40899.1 membrane protein [Streptomyces nodosus]MBB4791988.1 putative RDD family membrane protein YckC [Streptomyces nodosus]QEV39441.1 RDD family protein [Streptomyces nodosus]